MEIGDVGVLEGVLTAAGLLVAGGGVLALTRRCREALSLQLALFALAFASRFAMALVIYQGGLVDVLGDEDGCGWVLGVELRDSWVRAGTTLFDLPETLRGMYSVSHPGYRYLLGAWFFLTGTSTRLSASALNCWCGALTVVLAYRTARTLFPRYVADRVGWLTCLFPSLVVWSAQTVKEPVIMLLEAVALYGCLQLKRGAFSPRHALAIAGAVLLLVTFRFYAAYITMGCVVLALALPRSGSGATSLGAAVAVLLLTVPGLALSGVLARHEAALERFDLDYVDHYRRGLAVGTGSGVEAKYDLNTPEGIGMTLAVGASHLLLAPFPWQLGAGSRRMLLVGPEMLVWWWLFFAFVLPGIWSCLRHRLFDTLPLLLFVVGMGVLYSLTFGNIGLVYRQRAQLLPWLLIFAAVGMYRHHRRRRALDLTELFPAVPRAYGTPAPPARPATPQPQCAD
jgi:hypothetical protein